MPKSDRAGMRGVAAQVVNDFDISKKTANKKKIEQAISDWRKSGDVKVADGRVVMSKQAQEEMVSLAYDLADDIVIKDPVIESEYKDLKKELSVKMYFSQEDRNNITDWSYYNRNENALKLSLDRGNISVDSKYQELLNGPHGYLFRDNEATNPAEQVQQMNDVLYYLREKSRGESILQAYGSDGRAYREEMKDAITASIDYYVREELLRQASNRRK